MNVEEIKKHKQRVIEAEANAWKAGMVLGMAFGMVIGYIAGVVQ